MIGGGEVPGASGGRQLADELCITLKNALGIRSNCHGENGKETSVLPTHDGLYLSTGEVTTADEAPFDAFQPIRITEVPVEKSKEPDDISSARAAYLEGNKSVDPALLDQALSDCYGRFVALLPEEVLTDHVHLCFYLREAHWWYLDKWVLRHHDKLMPMKFGPFLSLVCDDCLLLRSFITETEREMLLSSWRDYNRRIPLRGGILINVTCDKVLLVQSYQSNHWTFPRGKTDESEDDVSCAAREIMEEVGLDVRKYIHREAFLESEIDGKNIKLFLIPGINEQDALQPKTDYEIKHIRWVPMTLLSDLLNNRTPNFVTFHVKQFVKGLWKFVQEFRKGNLCELFPLEYEQFVMLNNSSVTGQIKPSMTFRDTVQSLHGSPGKGTSTQQQNRLPRNRSTGNLKKQSGAWSETFGENTGWSADEMFRVNREKFGVESTYTQEDQLEKVSAHRAQRDLIPFDTK